MFINITRVFNCQINSGENYSKCMPEPAAPSMNFPFISYCFQHKTQTTTVKTEIHLFWIHTWINDTVIFYGGQQTQNFVGPEQIIYMCTVYCAL